MEAEQIMGHCEEACRHMEAIREALEARNLQADARAVQAAEVELRDLCTELSGASTAGYLVTMPRR